MAAGFRIGGEVWFLSEFVWAQHDDGSWWPYHRVRPRGPCARYRDRPWVLWLDPVPAEVEAHRPREAA